MQEADRILWDAWRERKDEHAFATLVEPHLRYARDLAVRRGLTPADADGAVQDALVRLAVDRTARPVEVGPRAWLGREVSLRARMGLRALVRRGGRGRRAERVPTRPPSALASRADAALADLPARQREAVVLRYVHDLDHEAVAYVLGASEAACRVRVQRGISSLRDRLGEGAGAMLAALPIADAPGGAIVPRALALAGAGGGAPARGPLASTAFRVAVAAVVLVAGVAVAVAVLRPDGDEGAPSAGEAPARPSAVRGSEGDAAPAVASATASREAPKPSPPAVEPAAPLPAAPASAGDLSALLAQIEAEGGRVAVDEAGRIPPVLLWLESYHDAAGRPVTGVRAGPGDRLAWLRRLGALASLWHLDLSGSVADDRDLGWLPALPALREIRLRGTAVTDDGLRLLADFERLEALDLAETQVTGRGLAVLTPQLPLRRLDLSRTKLDANGLAVVSELRTLTELRLRGNRVAAADALRELAALEVLDLAGTVLDAEEGRLPGGRRLRVLDLTDCTVEGLPAAPPGGPSATGRRGPHDDWVQRLFDGLEPYEALEDLSLAGLPLGGARAPYFVLGSLLSRGRRLARLDLSRTGLTDEHLRVLPSRSRDPSLRFLDLSGTAVTAAAVETLRERWPNVEVRIGEIPPDGGAGPSER